LFFVLRLTLQATVKGAQCLRDLLKFSQYRHFATRTVVDLHIFEKLKDIEVINFEKQTKVYLVAVKLQ
jgi:hypothetical protein